MFLNVLYRVIQTKLLQEPVLAQCAPPPTVGENREFWLLKTSLIFQGISWDLDVNVLKHITMKILLQIKRYFKFVL